jgi:hypothetical protein
MAGVLSGIAIRCDLVRKKMKQLGAVSEETAMKPEELGVGEWLLNHYMAKIRGIKRTEDGRYYVESKD